MSTVTRNELVVTATCDTEDNAQDIELRVQMMLEQFAKEHWQDTPHKFENRMIEGSCTKCGLNDDAGTHE